MDPLGKQVPEPPSYGGASGITQIEAFRRRPGRGGVYHQCTGVEHPVPRAAVEGYDGTAAVERGAPDLPDDAELVVPLILGPVEPPRGWVDGQPNRIVHPVRRVRTVMDGGRAAAVKRGTLILSSPLLVQ